MVSSNQSPDKKFTLNSFELVYEAPITVLVVCRWILWTRCWKFATTCLTRKLFSRAMKQADLMHKPQVENLLQILGASPFCTWETFRFVLCFLQCLMFVTLKSDGILNLFITFTGDRRIARKACPSDTSSTWQLETTILGSHRGCELIKVFNYNNQQNCIVTRFCYNYWKFCLHYWLLHL